MESKGWVVCKFGGTSVSSRKTWDVIVDHVRKLSGEGFKVCVVVSAVSQATNNLERVVTGLARENSDGGAIPTRHHGGAGASQGSDGCARATESGRQLTTEALEWLVERHSRHCQELDVDESIPAPFLEELQRLVEGIRLTGDAASSRLRARVLTFGELMSSHIGYVVLKRELQDLQVGIVDARRVLVSSGKDDDAIGPQNDDDKFLNADVSPFSLDLEYAMHLTDASDLEVSSFASGTFDPRSAFFVNKDVVITQGFVASTPEGQPCVLGRGGSDTSGALFAALLSAKRLEIWTDVDGMFSSDPRFVPNARLIEELSYREAQELAAMGAKVLHPRCLGPASWGNIPVEIHNTMSKSTQTTRIMAPAALQQGGENKVMAIARRTGQVLLTISTVDMWGESGFLSRVFAPFERLDISVDLIATSQYAVSMTLDYIPGGIDGEPFKMLLRALRKQGSVQVETDCTVVSIVGRKLRSVLHHMADAFRELERYNLLLLSESTEDLNMSFVLGKSANSVDELVLSLHHVLLERPLRRAQSAAAQDSKSSTAGSATMSPPASPVPRKLRGASFSSLSLLPAQAVAASSSQVLADRLDPSSWLQAELAKYESVDSPFAIVDLAALKKCAAAMVTFSMSNTALPAIVRCVYNANHSVIFMCRNMQQVLDLCSIVGPSPTVYLPPLARTPVCEALVPPSVRFVDERPAIDDVARSSQLFGDARVLVATVTDVLHDGETLCIDAWFQTKPGQRVTVLSDISPAVRKVRAVALHDDLHETLFTLESNTDGGPGIACQLDAPARLLISGVASAPFASATQAPVPHFIRFESD